MCARRIRVVGAGVLAGIAGALIFLAARADGSARTAQASPAPARIAFTVGRYSLGCGPDFCFESFIDTVELQGSGPRTLFRQADEEAANPAFSHRGDRVVYETTPGSRNSRIVLAAADGSYPQRVATGRSPAWSPDDSMLAFARYERAKPRGRRYVTRIYTIPATGGPARRLTRGAEPAWSATGEIAFQRDQGSATKVGVIPAAGGSARVLANGFTPTWSPDGQQIAFADGRSSIYVMSSEGTGVRRLCLGEDPAWSPDGSQIAFTREAGSVQVINVDGSKRRRLVRARNLKLRRSDSMFVATPTWWVG